ncbi:hypothetical protein E4U39_004431 [Claviceps sp. Clav50 group G5]|nr:hypothetical protein E4U39_004431 [Claviceps sp. Clav50 group G5]
MENYPQQCNCVDCESNRVIGYPCTAYSYPSASRPKRYMPDEFRHEEPRGTKRARTLRDDDPANMPGPSTPSPWYPPTPKATAFEARGSNTRAPLGTPVVSTDSYPPVMAYNPVSQGEERLPGVDAVLAQAYGNAWVSSNDETSGPALAPILGLVPEEGPRYAASRMHTWPESGIISPPLEGASRHVPDNMPAGPPYGYAARGPAPKKTSRRKQTGVQQRVPHVPQTSPPSFSNKRYTVEQGDFIVYAREDLSLSWPGVATAFANLFHEGCYVRRHQGLEGWYYRNNTVIPEFDSDGRLVFEGNGQPRKPRTRGVKCRDLVNGKTIPIRTGFGLGHRHPERGMGYEWVRPDHRLQFQDWGNKRKAQFEFEAIREPERAA